MTGTALLGGSSWVTDGGLETDLSFNRGADLPHFAAFPLLEDPAGRAMLSSYLGEYAAIASAAGAGLVLETPTWRANPDWAALLGYDGSRLDAVNRRAVDLVGEIGAGSGIDRVLLSGVVGPRGDGYVAAGATADEAADYHRAQVAALASGGVDLVHAMTLSEVAEAIGVVRAARDVGVTVAVSFTVETDGRLPDGTSLPDAIAQVDAVAAPDWYGLNCAHPSHVLAGVLDDACRDRVVGFRPNASTLTHAELDEMEVLDTGDVALLVRDASELRRALPSLRVLGGCCGTDSAHVAALWGVPAPARDGRD